MPPFLKTAAQRAAVLLIVGIARLLFATCRIRFSGIDNMRTAEGSSGGYLLAMWHEHALTGSAGHVHQPLGALVSPSKDGSVLAYLFEKMGVVPVRGSSTRGGKAARGEITNFVNGGVAIAISVDGPKGPHRVCKPGIVSLARDTGASILPGVAVANRAWKLGTWDGLLIPKPFTRILVHHGAPMQVPADSDGETFAAMQTQVEQRINATLAEAQAALPDWDQVPKGYPRPKLQRGWVQAMRAKHGLPTSSVGPA